MEQWALPESSHTSPSSSLLPSWSASGGSLQCSQCGEWFSSPIWENGSFKYLLFCCRSVQTISGWLCFKILIGFILWDRRRATEIGCDHLEEVKFICRQQLPKVWGWVGVNYYSSEAKFTCSGRLPNIFELFEEGTSKPEKAAFWATQTYLCLYSVAKPKPLPGN